eukprot:436521-Rhodomonas_salina.1
MCNVQYWESVSCCLSTQLLGNVRHSHRVTLSAYARATRCVCPVLRSVWQGGEWAVNFWIRPKVAHDATLSLCGARH